MGHTLSLLPCQPLHTLSHHFFGFFHLSFQLFFLFSVLVLPTSDANPTGAALLSFAVPSSPFVRVMGNVAVTAQQHNGHNPPTAQQHNGHNPPTAQQQNPPTTNAVRLTEEEVVPYLDAIQGSWTLQLLGRDPRGASNDGEVTSTKLPHKLLIIRNLVVLLSPPMRTDTSFVPICSGDYPWEPDDPSSYGFNELRVYKNPITGEVFFAGYQRWNGSGKLVFADYQQPQLNTESVCVTPGWLDERPEAGQAGEVLDFRCVGRSVFGVPSGVYRGARGRTQRFVRLTRDEEWRARLAGK